MVLKGRLISLQGSSSRSTSRDLSLAFPLFFFDSFQWMSRAGNEWMAASCQSNGKVLNGFVFWIFSAGGKQLPPWRRAEHKAPKSSVNFGQTLCSTMKISDHFRRPGVDIWPIGPDFLGPGMNGTMVHSLVPPLPTWQMLKAYDSVRTWPFLGMLMGSSTGFIADFSDESTSPQMTSLWCAKKLSAINGRRWNVPLSFFFCL